MPWRLYPRQLTVEQLGQSGTQRMLLDYVDRLEKENDELSDYRGRFHAADKEAATLRTQLTESRRRKRTEEILGGTGLAVGGALIGVASDLQGANAWIVGIVSLSLIVAIPLVVWLTRRGEAVAEEARNEG